MSTSGSEVLVGKAQSSSAPEKTPARHTQAASGDARCTSSNMSTSVTKCPPVLVSSTLPTTRNFLSQSTPSNHAGGVPTGVEKGSTNKSDTNAATLNHKGKGRCIDAPVPAPAPGSQYDSQHQRRTSSGAGTSKKSSSSTSPQSFTLQAGSSAMMPLPGAATPPFEPFWSRTPEGKKATFTTDMNTTAKYQGGHYGKVMNIPTAKYQETYDSLMQEKGWLPKLHCHRAIVSSYDENNVDILLCFNHIHDNEEAFREVNSLLSEGKLDRSIRFHKIDQSEYDSKAPEDGTTYFDGQVCVGVVFREIHQSCCPEAVSNAVYKLAEESGEILAFARACDQVPTVFRVEFFEISAAEKFGQKIGEQGQPFLEEWLVAAWKMTEFFMHTLPQKPGSWGQKTSPTGRSAWMMGGKGKGPATQPENKAPGSEGKGPWSGSLTKQTPQRQGHFRSNGAGRNSRTPREHPDGLGPLDEPPRSRNGRNVKALYDPDIPEPYQGDAQHVLKWKIAKGVDVRTTLMLRNLPNILTYADVKEMLDGVSFGKYDFSYLRIDFAQSLNVGYGFVNFIHPNALLEFVDRWGNQKWTCTRTAMSRGRERDARFSYATIQGYDCLIDKFRNSAVMDEPHEFRPKVWWTIENAPIPPMVCTEKEFPCTNNESKKKRSVDNAAQIGLYSNSRRSERRGRYSLYDRGTSAQMREDAFYDNQMGYMGQNGSFGYQTSPNGYMGNNNNMLQNGQFGYNNGFTGQNGQMTSFYQMRPNGQVAFQNGQFGNGQFSNAQMGFSNSMGYLDQTAYNTGYNQFQNQYPATNSQAVSWPVQDWSQGFNASPPGYSNFQYNDQYQSQGQQQYPAPPSSMDSSSDPFTDTRPSGSSYPYRRPSMQSRGGGMGRGNSSRPSPQFGGGAMYSGSRPGGPVMPPYGSAAAGAHNAHVPRTIPPQESQYYNQQQQPHFQMQTQQQQQYQQMPQQQQMIGWENDLSQQFGQTSFFDSAAGGAGGAGGGEADCLANTSRAEQDVNAAYSYYGTNHA